MIALGRTTVVLAVLIRITSVVLGGMGFLVPAAVIGWLLAGPACGDSRKHPASRPAAACLNPYAADEDHLCNRLHQALFVREAADGSRHVHSTDPLLYRGGTFLLEGKPHRRAVKLLDEFLSGPGQQPTDDPLKRLFFQRDLWATFDYAAWYPDDWVHHSRHEPAAVALRTRLARAIGRLALNDREIAALPDNYVLAVKSKQYPASYEAEHPGRPFLPADLFDPTGTWVRFHDETGMPMAERHFEAAGGRAVHIIFLRLPGGRAATEQYLKELKHDSVKQFPAGTMVAMVRRATCVDKSAKVRVTPLTELVQIRVYRRIPADPQANHNGDFGGQDMYEFVLDRAALFAGQHGLRPVADDEPADLFTRTGSDPFAPGADPPAGMAAMPQMKTCIQCHQAPGVFSVLSMQRSLHGSDKPFRTFAWDVELSFTVKAKVKQFDWGLLQGSWRPDEAAARALVWGLRRIWPALLVMLTAGSSVHADEAESQAAWVLHTG